MRPGNWQNVLSNVSIFSGLYQYFGLNYFPDRKKLNPFTQAKACGYRVLAIVLYLSHLS